MSITRIIILECDRCGARLDNDGHQNLQELTQYAQGEGWIITRAGPGRARFDECEACAKRVRRKLGAR